MRGRFPRPPHLRSIDLRQEVARLTSSGPGVGSPPDWLSPEARAEWDAVVLTAPPGLLRPIDAGLLEQYCVHRALWRAMVRRIAKDGAIAKDPSHGTYRQTAWAKRASSESLLVARLGQQLGLSPRSRQLIVLPPELEPPKSELERLLDEPVPGDFPRPS